MNARLLEIVKQSGLLNILTEHQNEYAGGGEFDFRAYPEVEKFAALIIADHCRFVDEIVCAIEKSRGLGGEE